MSLHQDLNIIPVLMNEIKALDTATRELDLRRAKASSPALAMMFELCRDELNKELEYQTRRLRNTLNNFYNKHEVAYWRPDARKTTADS